MNSPNPLHLANTAQQLARNAPKDDAVAFSKVTMVFMVVMTAPSLLISFFVAAIQFCR